MSPRRLWFIPLVLAMLGAIGYVVTASPPKSVVTQDALHANRQPSAASSAAQTGDAGFLLIRGAFVIIGKSPDGDSLRFIPDNPDSLRRLGNSYRIKPSKDGSVQLRFEAIDAPELHFGNDAQPLGAEARDALLKLMGFKGVQFKGTTETVASSQPERLRGAILSQAAEVNGRPISYVLLEADAGKQPDGARVKPDAGLLGRTLNDAMLRSGLAYYTVYSSTPVAQRDYFRGVAAEAQRKKLGVWKLDATAGFKLEAQESVGVNGQLVLPKLFRRCTSYFQDVAKRRFSGSLVEWLIASRGTNRPEDDEVQMGAKIQNLSSLLEQKGNLVSLKADTLEMVFVEK
jgi:endonuclease YncB( thermonuclease family)